MKTCSCSKPVKVKIPEPWKIDKNRFITSPRQSGKSQVLTGAKAVIKINGRSIGTFSSAEFKHLPCPQCKGRGWIATTKAEKKLIGILE